MGIKVELFQLLFRQYHLLVSLQSVV